MCGGVFPVFRIKSARLYSQNAAERNYKQQKMKSPRNKLMTSSTSIFDALLFTQSFVLTIAGRPVAGS